MRITRHIAAAMIIVGWPGLDRREAPAAWTFNFFVTIVMTPELV
jgi:hypothetical protein